MVRNLIVTAIAGIALTFGAVAAPAVAAPAASSGQLAQPSGVTHPSICRIFNWC